MKLSFKKLISFTNTHGLKLNISDEDMDLKSIEYHDNFIEATEPVVILTGTKSHKKILSMPVSKVNTELTYWLLSSYNYRRFKSISN